MKTKRILIIISVLFCIFIVSCNKSDEIENTKTENSEVDYINNLKFCYESDIIELPVGYWGELPEGERVINLDELMHIAYSEFIKIKEKYNFDEPTISWYYDIVNNVKIFVFGTGKLKFEEAINIAVHDLSGKVVKVWMNKEINLND